ncbi:MAG TPA: enolase C-terminal domain-like protein [Candidatus Acidoferrum sp.]|nr:enolase C-terminal domain-like protein [Candidatus Acidoferrum sp.]
MTIVEAISVSKILDAIGDDALEVEVVTKNGYGRSSFPARGEAINMAKEAVSKLIGKDANQQAEIDRFLRETFSDSNLGAVFSIAIAKAAASSYDIPLCSYLGGAFSKAMPYPILRVFKTNVDYYAIVVGAKSVGNAVAISTYIHREFNKLEMSRRSEDSHVLNNLTSIIQEAGTKFRIDVRLGVGFKSITNFDGQRFLQDPSTLTSATEVDDMLELISRYKLYYIEDPFDKEDCGSLADLTNRAGNTCIICGDAIFDMNKDNILQGSKMGAANVVAINPARTITEIYEIVEFAKQCGYDCVFSTEGSTTCESALSHVAVALPVPFIKLSISGAESTSKLNELIRIEQEILEGCNCKMMKKPI